MRIQKKMKNIAVNSLISNDILDLIILKACADDKINVTIMMISVFDIKHIVGIGENAGYHLCFQKPSS